MGMIYIYMQNFMIFTLYCWGEPLRQTMFHSYIKFKTKKEYQFGKSTG